MTTRVNLCKNPSLEVDTTGYWNGTRVTTETYTGTASLQMGAGAANNRLTGYGANSNATANADAIPIAPGEQVTFSVYVKAAAAGPSIRLKIHWFNASGGWISDHDNAAVVPGTSWTRLNITGATAPANAAKFGVVIFDWYGGSGGTIFADGWLVEKSATLGDYFDGSTVKSGYTYAWAGAAHNSTSTEAPAQATRTRTNLLKNPSLEVDGLYWTPNPARNNTPYAAYSGSYKVHQQNAAFTSDMAPATAGLPYTGSGYFKANAATWTPSLSVHFYDSSNVELSPPTAATATSPDNQNWFRVWQTRIAPAGTTQVALRVSHGTSYVAYISDAFLLEQSSFAGSYFDGTTAGAAWDGTAHASTSTLTFTLPTVNLKHHESGAFVARTAVPRYWSHAERAWKEKRPKRWNGTAWVDLN